VAEQGFGHAVVQGVQVVVQFLDTGLGGATLAVDPVVARLVALLEVGDTISLAAGGPQGSLGVDQFVVGLLGPGELDGREEGHFLADSVEFWQRRTNMATTKVTTWLKNFALLFRQNRY